MSCKFAAMMPRALSRTLTAFAWLALPLWGGAVWACRAHVDTDAMMLLVGLAATSTGCAMRAYQENRTDARIDQGLALHQHHEAELAALAGTMLDSGLMKVAPIPQPDGDSQGLRLVQNA